MATNTMTPTELSQLPLTETFPAALLDGGVEVVNLVEDSAGEETLAGASMTAGTVGVAP
jgi:hypothetical protein